MNPEAKRIMRAARRRPRTDSFAFNLTMAGQVRRSLAYAKKRWPEFTPPAQVFRWWKLAKFYRLVDAQKGFRLP